MPHDHDSSKEFQQRRATTWRIAKPWLSVLLLGWLGIFIIIPMERTDLWLLCFVIIAVVTIRINFILMKYYHCPACGRMPIAGGMRGGVMLDPEECPKCGALLR